jgi:hypothetical protein
MSGGYAGSRLALRMSVLLRMSERGMTRQELADAAGLDLDLDLDFDLPGDGRRGAGGTSKPGRLVGASRGPVPPAF